MQYFLWGIEIAFNFFYCMPYSYFTSFPSATTFILYLTPSFALKRKMKDKRDKLRALWVLILLKLMIGFPALEPLIMITTGDESSTDTKRKGSVGVN